MYSDRFLSDTSRYAFLRSTLISLLGMVLLPLALAGCSDNPVGSGEDEVQKQPSNTTLQIEGTLDRQMIDGREAWVIEAEDGQTYLPVNLKTETLGEGFRVRAEAKSFGAPLIEDLREEIDRELPEERVVDAYSGRLIKIKSIDGPPVRWTFFHFRTNG